MIDMHVHFFPAAVFRAIWKFFEKESEGLWPINYKVHGEEHIETLRAQGVEKFTTQVYAHKTGMADVLNEFVAESARRYPEVVPFGTIFAGDGNVAARARNIFEERGFRGIKLHPFVSGEMLDDERFFPAYEIMEDLGKILVCHPGSGPNYSLNDGANRLRKVLNRIPNLRLVVAHCGAVEYDEYMSLADDFEHVYFDTAMNCVHFHAFEGNCPGPAFFKKYGKRILFGTDFPNIPYDYEEQIQAIRRLNLGDDLERNIFHDNAARLLGMPVTRTS